jgi:hypothetical protein
MSDHAGLMRQEVAPYDADTHLDHGWAIFIVDFRIF